jgi:hypothetical protein
MTEEDALRHDLERAVDRESMYFADAERLRGKMREALGILIDALASGTEARRAETPQSGSVHDGPVPKADAHE